MSDLHVGKLTPDKMAGLIQGAVGAKDNRIIVGPGAGLDAAVIDIGNGRVMAVAEDPIFPAPALPLDTFGWFTAHIGASDVAVTGVKPEFMTYSLLLPPGFPESDTRTIIKSVSDAAEELGIAVIGGHTGWYGAVVIPTIGGVSVWGFADADKWISPGGAKDGDVLLITKGPSIEAGALLALLRQKPLRAAIGSAHVDSLIARTSQITVVDDALTAYSADGVHAMHDATEGGVLGGLWEISSACGISVSADIDSVPVPDDIAAVARTLAFDPWAAISEGTLLAAVDPSHVADVQRALSAKNIESWKLGEFDAKLARSRIGRNGSWSDLPLPGKDPFWDLFVPE
jgi:hydrogenase maturation factor